MLVVDRHFILFNTAQTGDAEQSTVLTVEATCEIMRVKEKRREDNDMSIQSQQCNVLRSTSRGGVKPILFCRTSRGDRVEYVILYCNCDNYWGGQ